MSNFVAVYDACVLYPASLRNLLMHLALSGVFRARWTARIHDEWMEHLLTNRPDIPRQKLERTRRLMDESVPDCVVTGYEGLEAGLHLPDPDDCHVLAAAIMCSAGTIVTFNLDDFPESALAPWGITAQHPDEFIEHAFGIDPAAVIAAVRDHRASLANPARTVDELLDSYLEQGLATTVGLLKPHAIFL
ncbi:MAG TPA: PIN domain-containing protein [Rhodanobacteraceae bacterium]|nr:PIN domain-containing protein [Rhodanobacteraceae bacterium]